MSEPKQGIPGESKRWCKCSSSGLDFLTPGVSLCVMAPLCFRGEELWISLVSHDSRIPEWLRTPA